MNIFDLSAKISLDSSEYEKGLDGAESKTNSFGSKLGSALGTGAKVAGAAIAAVGAATTAMGAAALKASGDTAAYGDNIDKMSQKLGMSAEAYQEWDAIMQHSGTSIDSMTSAMKTLATQAEKDGAAFETIGLSLDEISGMSQEELFSATITALQNMEEGTERTAAASKLLGKGAIELGALLNTSAEDTEAMRQRVHELGGVMSNEAVKSAAAYQDSLQDMQTSISSIGKNLTSNFLPGLTQVMDGLTEIFAGGDGGSLIEEGINSLASNINEKLPQVIAVGEKILSSLISAISDNLPSIMQAGIDALSALGQGIMDNLPQLAQAATEIILMLIRYIVDALPQFVEAAIQIVATLAQGIAEALPELIPAIVDMVMQIVQALIDNAPLLLDAALQLVTGLAQGFLNALPVLIDALPGIIIGIVDFFVGAIPQIIEAGITLLTALVEALPQIIEAIVAALPLIIDGIINGLISNLPQMIEAGIKLFVALIEALPTIITTIVGAIPQIITAVGTALAENSDTLVKAGFELFVALIKALPQIIMAIVKAVPQIISGIVNAFGDSIGAIIEVGKDIVGGIWQGIVGAADQFMKDVKEFFGGIIDGVKDFLGIRSPSKLFKEQIGKMIGLGVAQGIEESEDKAVKAADKLAKNVYSKSKDWIDKQTKYNKWSLDEQLEAWQAAQEQFIEGSKQYADAEEQIFDLREKIRERDEKAVEEQVKTYTSKIEEGLAKVRDLWDDYKSTYEKERNSIYGAFGLFASPKDREYVEGVDLMDNLRRQVRDINQFYDGLEELQSRGLGRELVDEIRAMGPSAINEVLGLLDLSQEQLDEYWELYKHKADVATYWTDRYTENLKNITEGSIMRIFDGLDVTMDDALDAAYNWGYDYMEQLAKGIQAGEVDFFNTDNLIAGRLSGDSRWSGDMNVVINTLAGQSAVEIANMTYKKIINEFTNRKQVWA